MKNIIALRIPILLLALLVTSCNQETDPTPVGASQNELTFRSTMDRLWQDHITWTRNVIINVIDDAPGLNEATARLLQNQVDIGDAIKPYYGTSAGDALTVLLKTHITGAADVLVAAKNGESGNLANAQARWQANADSIATFLSTANPNNWPEADLKAMMREHLTLTTNEAVARINKDYSADIAAYDAVRTQALHMSMMLADGIVNQFPEKF